MSVKYYDGFEVENGREVTAEAAQRLEHHAKAFFGASGTLEKVELHSSAKVVRVDYYGERSDDDIRASHVKTYKGIDFAIHRPLARVGSFGWEYVHSYSASGELQDITAILEDRHHLGWMEVYMDLDKRVTGIMKSYWEGPDVLKYVFEYDEHGRLFSVHDVVHGESTSFQDVKAELPDPHFFESGLALPKEIAGTAIPR